MTDEDAVIGTAIIEPVPEQYYTVEVRLSDLDEPYRNRLNYPILEVDGLHVGPNMVRQYRERIAELEADLERVAEERDEALAQCNILGHRGDGLEARLAKAEAALEAADIFFRYPCRVNEERWQQAREAMK